MIRESILNKPLKYGIMRNDIGELMLDIANELVLKVPMVEPHLIYEVHSNGTRYGLTKSIYVNKGELTEVVEVPIIVISVDNIYDILYKNKLTGSNLENVYFKLIELTIMHELIHYIHFYNRKFKFDRKTKSMEDLRNEIESLCTQDLIKLIDSKFKCDGIMKLLVQLEMIDLSVSLKDLTLRQGSEMAKSIFEDLRRVD